MAITSCKHDISEKSSTYSEYDKFVNKEDLSYCDSVFKSNITFNIIHENFNEIDFKDYEFIISYSGLGEVYHSKFKSSIELKDIEICSEEYYSVRFDILDKKNNKRFWWSNKESYLLSQYEAIEVVLLSKRIHTSSDEVLGFKINLK